MHPSAARFVRRLVAQGAVAAAIGGAASAIFAGQGCVDEAASPSAAPPIVIGVSLGLTGDLDTFAGPLRDAIRAAEGELNAGGGLLGRPVRFDVMDDRSDEGEIVRGIAQGFVRDGVAAVIGPIGSQQVVLTQQTYVDGRIVQISPAATSTELSTMQTVENRFFFRTTPADDFQGAAVMLLAQKTPKGLGDGGAPKGDGGQPITCKRLAILHTDNSYGSSMADLIEASWPKRGAGRAIVMRRALAVELAASYAAEAAELIAAKPECAAIVSYEKVAAQLVHDVKLVPGYKAIADNGFFFIGTDGVYTPGFLELSREDRADETSPSTAEGVFGTNPDTQPGTKEYNEFKTIYRSYFPAQPDAPPFTANTYDAAILLALAIQKAGSATDGVAIRDALREVAVPPGKPFTPAQVGEALLALRQGQDVDYKGASGNVDFEEDGNVRAGFIVWEAYRNTKTNKVEYRTVAQFSAEELMEQIQ